MQNIILKAKQKSLQLQAYNVDTWWNLVQDMLQIDLKTQFDEHKAYETYKKKLKAYREAYIEFRYNSPFETHQDNFNISDFNWYEIGLSGKAQEVQSSAPT